MNGEKQTVNVFKDKNTGEWIKELDSTKERIKLDEKDKVITGMLDDLENLPYLFGMSDVAMRLCVAGYRKMPDNIGDFSDGYHTFNELYHHRAVLFSVICNMFPERAWKSMLHDTGDMYDGMFIVGIETEQGQATYHYDIDPYWDMFKVKELEKAPKYDGHTPSDAIERIGNLPCSGYRKQSEGEWIWINQAKGYLEPPYGDTCKCSLCEFVIDISESNYNFCPNCGAKMKGGAE